MLNLLYVCDLVLLISVSNVSVHMFYIEDRLV